VQAGAGLRAAGRARVRAGGAPPPRGQSRPRESKGAVGDAPGLTRRRRVGLVVELAGCLPGVPTLRPATGTHGLLQLRQEAHTGASVMDGGLEAAPRMARLGRAPARDLGVAARGGIRAATGGGRCGFFPPFLSAVFGHARGRRAVGVAPRPVSVWWGARGKIASSAKTSGAEREKGKSS